MKRATVFALVLVAAAIVQPPPGRILARQAGATSAPSATRPAAVTAASGMVASAHTLASEAGLKMLRAGGNAVDAAVAAAFAVGVVEPNATGIGGEGMMLIHLASSRRTIAVDYRSTAPRTAKYAGAVPANGHAAVAVPGTVAGLVLAQGKYGRLKLATVVGPAVQLAERGFVVSSTLAGILADNFEEIGKNEPLARILCPGGLPLEPGDTLRNPDLASTLRRIGSGGADVFYKGAIADRIAAEMAATGGFISREDLASYRAIEREPVRGSYRGYQIVSAPPPVAGLSVVEILQILDQLSLDEAPHLSARHVHLFAEAMKRGFADYNAFVGDPGFTEVPVRRLLSADYARQRAAEIDVAKVSTTVGAGRLVQEEPPSTTSLSVVDRRGNMVALTQTISDFFGAKVVVEGTGILLNNEMKNFSALGPNRMEPGKRMRTAIAPTIVLRAGRPFATIGTPGGTRIISTMALLLSNLIDYRMGIQEAIEAPRFHARDTSGELAIEARVPPRTEQALADMGYRLRKMGAYDLFFGGAQGIVIDARTGRRMGGADPRRDGAVVGY